MSRIAAIICLALAVALIGAVGLGDPSSINRGVNAFFGWVPEEPQDVRLVASEEAARLRALAAEVSEDTLRAEIDRFASWGSRVPGYAGADSAYAYIRAEFERLGLEDIRTDAFEVAVPVDKGASLQIDGEAPLRLHALWPNGVRTSTLPDGGVSGPLVYGAKASLKELDGLPLEGSVVLLDFACGQDYLNAASLGASAVVFFDNGGVSREQAADKFLKVPVDVPRFWIDAENGRALAARLRGETPTARVQGRMDWETVEAKNVYAWLPGSGEDMPAGSREERQAWNEQVLVLQANYDAMSVVPALAPGAENATGIVALLHLAELLQREKPKYRVLLLATAAHFEGLSGINDFLHRHSRRSEYFKERKDPAERIDFDLMVGLDLSSHNGRTATFGFGTFYNANWATDNYVKYMLTPYSQRLTLAVKEIFGEEGRHIEAVSPPKRTWKNYMPVPLAFASEAASFVGQKALTVATPNDVRGLVDTPNDLPGAMNMGKYRRQVETLSALALWATRDAGLLKPTKLELEDYGHSVSGHAYWFDRDINFAVPKAPVPRALVTYQQLGPNSVAGVRTLMVQQANGAGRFSFDIVRNQLSNTFKAYEIGPRGEIASAVDMGEEGDKTYPTLHPWGWWENEMLLVLFKCSALSLFETVDSQYLSVLDHVTVLNDRDGTPQSWGADYVEQQSTEEGKVTLAATVYARPGTRVKVMMSTSLFGVRYLLSGAPAEWVANPLEPEQIDEDALKRSLGAGYPVEAGRVLHPAWAAARDMWVLDDVRIKQLARYGVRNNKFMQLHEDARLSLLEAEKHLKARRYSAFKAEARRAWGLEARGYPDIKTTADDTVYGVIFYFALLLPFSFFCERLFVGAADVRRQLLGGAAFFIGIFLVMQYIHPAFKLSSSPYIIFLAFVIFAIGSTALFLILGRFTEVVAERKRAAAGLHEADIGRLSATAAAITLGISNLRKRKLRTFLTVVTLTILTFTAQSFTSVQSFLKFYQIPRENVPAYDGALLRDRGWRGLQTSVLDYAASAFGDKAQIIPRSWYIAQLVGDRALIDIERPDGRAASFSFGLLGLTPQERRAMSIDRHLVGERSRWFEEGDGAVCLLPQAMAEILEIGPDDVGTAEVETMGRRYRVIGIFDDEAVDGLRDLDNESPMPMDTVAEAKKMSEMQGVDPRLLDSAAIESYAHLLAANIVLMPYQEVVDLGGTLRSIAITGFDDGDELVAGVEEFVSRVAMPLFVGREGSVKAYTSMGAASLAGMGNLIIPLLIAALIVLNTMMGAVYERAREIGVYSSVGLAPNHVAALFIAEAAVFATLGAVLGYLLGQTVTLVLTRFELMQGMFLNYSSLSAVSSTIIVMATVIVSTLYPARKAASLAVPDVTRRWEFPPPQGDSWAFDFPFTIGRTDALGVCAYLHRIFEAYGEGSVGDFMTEGVALEREGDGAEPAYVLDLQVWLAPYDLGVSQRVKLRTLPDDEVPGIYRIEMELTRLSGDVASWQRLNTGFLNVLRKRFLVWRTVEGATREEYLALGRQMVETEGVGV